MADVAIARHHRHTSSIGSMTAGALMHSTSPTVEMLPNPDFVFPMQPRSTDVPTIAEGSKRPVSMQIQTRRAQSAAGSHGRSASTLPGFSFNAVDTSGLLEAASPPLTPTDGTRANATALSRAVGHKRGASEFIGGDGRFGTTGLMSTSPTKSSSALPLPGNAPSSGPPTGRRGHAHRRSAAMSSHDLSSMLQPRDANAPTPGGAATTPAEEKDQAQCPPIDRSVSAPSLHGADVEDPFVSTPESESARPPSRRVVGFSDNVEYIPRPLSTISSETESSVSTMPGHSAHNSLNSVVNMGSPSPPSARLRQRRALSLSMDADATARSRSSLETTKRIEHEGRWLKSEPINLKRPLSDSAATPPSLPLAPDANATPRLPQKKHQSFGFDRRKSEPLISGLGVNEHSRLSTISLQETAKAAHSGWESNATPALDRKSSTKKIRAWASAKISRMAKDANKTKKAQGVEENDRPVSEGSSNILGDAPTPETDLDAVFAQEPAMEMQPTVPGSQPRIEIATTLPSQHSMLERIESEDMSPVVDLDAALGPYGTPAMSWESRANATSSRKQLHSSRINRDFAAGPGAYSHRRAESAPALTPFDFPRLSTPTQPAMADVFEEEEEEDAPVLSYEIPKPAKTSSVSSQEEALNVGISVVDADMAQTGAGLNWGVEDGLRINSGWVMERPTTSYGRASPRLSTPVMERRPSSIIEETIVEESSPAEPVEIVEDHEEPRSSSLTKSSDSSDTPTLMAAQPGMLALPNQAELTPDSYTLSTFSSPDFSRRQGSFDTSRLGTSASSITDNRTLSSCATGEPGHENRVSVDDVPSLTSSRSTMVSTMHPNTSRRDFSDRSTATVSSQPKSLGERQRKRSSIHSLSQLMGGPFTGKPRTPSADSRPDTATEVTPTKPKKKKEHRLSKLMFWKSKHSSQSNIAHSKT